MIQHEEPHGVRIHPTAMVEDGVRLGSRTSIWDNVHIRHGAVIGEECIVGEKNTAPACRFRHQPFRS